MWSVYLVECSDATLYCGIAKDVEARVAKHDAGKGAKYTRGRGPVRLLCSQGSLTKSEALKLEIKVKKQPRDSKERFLREWKTSK